MKITIAPHRNMLVLFFEHAGRRWVQFVHESNHTETVELPVDAKIVHEWWTRKDADTEVWIES